MCTLFNLRQCRRSSHASIITRVKETVFVKDGAPILSDKHPVMQELLKGPFPKGALVLSLALMPGTLTPSDCPCRTALADGSLPVLFERGRLESTVLGNCTNDHPKAFMELLGMAALHLAYVAYASDDIFSGGLRYQRHRRGSQRPGWRSSRVPATA